MKSKQLKPAPLPNYVRSTTFHVQNFHLIDQTFSLNFLGMYFAVSGRQHNWGMFLTRLKNPTSLALAMILGTGVLTGCSSEPPIAMPAAQVTRFVLDLSGSNDVNDQYERMKPSIYKELSLDSLGNPYSTEPSGPIDLSMTFIVGSASQASVASITKADFGYKLFSDLEKVYGRTSDQIVTDWPLVLSAYSEALGLKSLTNSEMCVNKIFGTMEVNLSEETSKEIAARLCKEASSTNDLIENKIPRLFIQASGSDVFGSFREIDTWVEKTKVERPDSRIKVVFASDMVHWTNGQRDLFGAKGLLTGLIGKNEICEIAKTQSELSSLNLTGVRVDIIGRGNAQGVSADQGEALAIFWKCFADASGFELNTSTDGRA
jgi:hypothetical protein